jgi:hypothetical protein
MMFDRLQPGEKTPEVLPPKELKKYFWDCDFNELRMSNHAVFITERILNFGNLPAIKWLLSVIDKPFLMDVVEHSRNLDKKTRNFWKIMLW